MRRIETGLAALLSIIIAVGLQIRSGAYHADFAATDDEPAHVVTSLMVHDYLLSGRLLHPWEFAKTYYLHYPKVAMLHWPPMFHLSEAIWMLAARRSGVALLWFQALAGASLAFSVFWFVRRDSGPWVATSASVLVLMSPPMQMAVSMVSPDMLLAAVFLWAAISCDNALWFWTLTLVALGIHGRAAPLLMLPFLAILLGRPDARRFRFAILAVLVLVAVYLVLPVPLRQAYATNPGTIARDGAGYLMNLGAALSWPILMLATVGMTVRKEMAAALLSCWIFHALVKVPFADYYLATAIPPAVILAAAGAKAIWTRAAAWRFATAAGLVGITLWTCGVDLRHPWQKPVLGARTIVNDHAVFGSTQTIWLVAGTADFEGAVIAEAALRDHAMEHIVLRASKMLAQSSWSGAGYRMRYSDAASILDFLDEAHVGWTAIRPGPLANPHTALLETALETDSVKWRRISTPAAGVELFERIQPLPGMPKIEIDLRDKLGTVVRFP